MNRPQKQITLPPSFVEGSNGEIVSVTTGKPVLQILTDQMTISDAVRVQQVIIQALSMAFPTEEARKAYEAAVAEEEGKQGMAEKIAKAMHEQSLAEDAEEPAPKPKKN